MPVTSVGNTPFRGSQSAPAAAAPAAAPQVAARPADGHVGHGVTRLKPRPGPHALHQPFIPGTPPPRGETAEGHGGHKGRISIR
jgi:hypothetical protein